VQTTALNHKVHLITDWSDGIAVEPGEVVTENIRFNVGEKPMMMTLQKKKQARCVMCM
jgi:hypothetical protein